MAVPPGKLIGARFACWLYATAAFSFYQTMHLLEIVDDETDETDDDTDDTDDTDEDTDEDTDDTDEDTDDDNEVEGLLSLVLTTCSPLPSIEGSQWRFIWKVQ